VVRTDSNEVGVFYSVTAARSGTYELRVSDAGANDTGAYTLTAFTPGSNFSYGEEGAEAESGRRRAAGVGPGDLDIWTIDTQKGQYIATEVTENKAGDPVQLGAILFAPDGSVAATKTSATGFTLEVPHTQTVTGLYQLVVYEPTAQVSGRYGITFARFPGKQNTEDPDTISLLPNNTTRNGDAPGGDFDIFAVYIDEGATFSATASRGSSGSLDPLLQLYNPDGSLNVTKAGSTSATINATAPISGTYWMLLGDRESDDGGNYNIKYNVSIDNSAPALQNGLLTIHGTSAADTITLDETTHNGIAAVDVNVNGTHTFYNKVEIERIEIYAGAGNDAVTDNTSINSYIFGDIGNDTLHGGGGRDTLTGAGGKNFLFGGDGDDRMNGSNGHDELHGEAGNDRLYGNGGNDLLDGGGNVDRLFGGDGDDVLVGGSGNDKLMGEAGNDRLTGGAGSDLLDGGAGTDTRGDHDSSDVIVSIEA
jgi:Ca2+-binding RTX toxin-like protein